MSQDKEDLAQLMIIFLILQIFNMNGIYYHYNEFASLQTQYTDFKIIHIDIVNKKCNIFSNEGGDIGSFDILFINSDKISIPEADLYFNRITSKMYKLEFKEEYSIENLNYFKLEPQKLNTKIVECFFKDQLIEINGYVFYKETGRRGQPLIYPVKSLFKDKLEYFNFTLNKIIAKSTSDE